MGVSHSYELGFA
ncbi:hypothetical protein MTR67_020164 [Solanum verrucosum]|nr:hypothetical protein MTR67_020164 [Solanum verrucosum]